MLSNSMVSMGATGVSEGEVVPSNGGPPVQYYPHRTPVIMRTAKKQAEYALEATPSDPIKGVKGVTLADLLPAFDTVRGTVTDYMHSVCTAGTMVKSITLGQKLRL